MHPTDDGRTEEADIIEPVSGHGKVIAKSFEETHRSRMQNFEEMHTPR